MDIQSILGIFGIGLVLGSLAIEINRQSKKKRVPVRVRSKRRS